MAQFGPSNAHWRPWVRLVGDEGREGERSGDEPAPLDARADEFVRGDGGEGEPGSPHQGWASRLEESLGDEALRGAACECGGALHA